MDGAAIDSNLNVLNDNLGVIDQKVSQLLMFLSQEDEKTKLPPGFKEQEMERMRDKLFADEKKESSLLRRFNQKRRVYQAVPIAIDSISLEGQRSLRKALKNLFSFNIDKKELDNKKTGLWGMLAALILGLLGGLLAFIKDKLKGLEAWWKGLNFGDDLADLFKTMREKIWKGFQNSKLASVFDDIAKSIRESKFGRFMREFKLPRFWQTENFLKALEEMKLFTKRINELPEYLREMNVDQLRDEIRKQKYIWGTDYLKPNRIPDDIKLKIQTLEKLLEFRQEGYALDDLIKELEVTAKELSKPKSLFQKAIESFGKAVRGLLDTAKSALEGLGAKLEGAVKALEKIPGVKTLFKSIPWVGSFISTLDTLYQVIQKKLKGEKVDDATLTATATTIVTNIIGWFARSPVLLPLAFLSLKQIEPVIRKIFESADKSEMLSRIFIIIPELLYKGFGMAMKFLIADLPMWIGKGWNRLFGSKEDGPIVKFFEYFSNELENFFTNFSLGDEIYKLGTSLGEGIVYVGIKIKEFLKNVLTKEFWKDILNKIFGRSKRTAQDDINDAKYIESILDDVDKVRIKNEVKLKKAGDLISKNDKVLLSGDTAYRFNKNDEFFAVRRGGPIDNIVESFSIKTKESNEKLIKEVKELNKKFSSIESFYKESLMLQTKQLKAVDSHTPFLKDIRNKDFTSNVLMSNRPNNIVVNNSESSALRYRSNLARSLV